MTPREDEAGTADTGQADGAEAPAGRAGSKPLFVVRQTYRRRRLADAARVLPFIGAAGFFLPILWRPASTPAPDTAPGAVWLFGVWVAIILAAWVMARLLSGRREPGARRGDG